MTNVWWIQEDILKGDDKLKKKIGQMMMLYMYMWLTDNVFEKYTGGRPLFDPIEAMIDAIEEIKANPDAEGYGKAAGRLFGEGVSNLPGGQFLGTSYPEYGFKLGKGRAPTRKEFFGSGDPTRFGSGLLSTKALTEPGYKILMPYGGGQLKKTIQGVKAYKEGKSTTSSGNFQYKIDKNTKNLLTAFFLGKYALPEAVKYYKDRDAPKKSSKSNKNSSGGYNIK